MTILSEFNDLSELEQELIEISQVLLDINHGEKNEEIINKIREVEDKHGF